MVNKKVLQFSRIYVIDVSCASRKTSREMSSRAEGAGFSAAWCCWGLSCWDDWARRLGCSVSDPLSVLGNSPVPSGLRFSVTGVAPEKKLFTPLKLVTAAAKSTRNRCTGCKASGNEFQPLFYIGGVGLWVDYLSWVFLIS